MHSTTIQMPIPNPTPTLHFPLPAVPSAISRAVAVIGAGAAGLCAALELRREGHSVVVYERQDKLGGTWAYTPQTEADPLGLDPTRNVVHSSVYASLRTNLPREVMGFRVYPFVASGKPGRDPRRFPGHEEVLEYLRDFAEEFELAEMVRFGREVCHVGKAADDRRWVVKSKRKGGGDGDDQVYDAVVICNGHYSEPRIVDLPGIEEWPGKQIHSHNYRVPDPFHDQVVVLIGSAASADDISRDIAKFAKEVHVASRSAQIGKIPGHNNIWQHSMIKSVDREGRVNFHDGDKTIADVILHCTGYKFSFPFLETNNAVSVDDNRVGPLYKHVFPPTLAPWLSFVGVPWKVLPFPLFELQTKWIAGVLSGRIALESTHQMTSDIQAFYLSLEAAGIPKRYTHKIGESYSQFEYDDWLAAKSGSPPIEEWRKQMYWASGRRKRSAPETYRDEWDDQDLMALAYQELNLFKVSVS
ncbi:flavin-containing monooxygenase FMO GS-OX-like 4 isoform X1 [Salvia miltiorrhiza]|uniref:flavin-containing monooxygenase FMO GS-OX-like 4 isoform X1 n=1 Tax=Salvia miltiorrhiza TaxID=226208 RepID=UPI0025ACBFDF|nr:flavin-containing monooxygenase FMO GS-OX-like 4 isoform X1 [Salvia miltiorrhiza]